MNLKWKNKRKRNRYKQKCNSIDKKEQVKKPSKLILRKNRERRNTRIGCIITIVLLSSPIWFYRGIMVETLLPIFGKEAKAVLMGKMGGGHARRGDTYPHYYYTFRVNGKLYKHLSRITWEEPPLQLGDTIKIIYLEAFPSISKQIEEDK